MRHWSVLPLVSPVAPVAGKFAHCSKQAAFVPYCVGHAVVADAQKVSHGDATQMPPPDGPACGQCVSAFAVDIVARPTWYWRHASESPLVAPAAPAAKPAQAVEHAVALAYSVLQVATAALQNASHVVPQRPPPDGEV